MPTVLEQLEQYTPQDRPAAVVHAMRQLAHRVGYDMVTIGQLAHEAHKGGYWSKVARPNGEPYLSEEDFFAEVLQVQTWRSALKAIAVGKAIESLPEDKRQEIAARLAEVGAAKAVILAPMLEAKPEAADRWIDRAEAMNAERLQAAVSDELGAKTRGTTGAPKEGVDRLKAAIINAMPDLESRAVAEEFFDLGHRVGAGETTVGILIAAMMECLGSWQPRPKSAATGQIHCQDDDAGCAGNHP